MKPLSIQDRLPRSFYDRRTETVARELLGKALLRKLGDDWIGGWIVETEAYLASQDFASHSARGKTPSNASMFGPPGTLYVYPIHAKYCMNAVTEPVGIGSAVLIRAVEPAWGAEIMMRNRRTEDPRRLTSGPAMLCQALQIDRDADAIDLVAGTSITIVDGNHEPPMITSASRIGISRSQDLSLRYFVDGNWYVSGPARHHRTRPKKPSSD